LASWISGSFGSGEEVGLRDGSDKLLDLRKLLICNAEDWTCSASWRREVAVIISPEFIMNDILFINEYSKLNRIEEMVRKRGGEEKRRPRVGS
jgi:hypothetical protein